MKQILLFLVFLTVLTPAKAEERSVSLSDPFPEPVGVMSKVVQCSNGNTFLFIYKKFGLECSLYDKNHKLVKKGNIVSRLWKPADMPDSYVEGIYEINGRLEVFVQQTHDRRPAIYRTALNLETGAIAEELKIHEMTQKNGSAFMQISGRSSGYAIIKDKWSDHYAVMVYNDFASETDQRIEIILYDGQHKELKRAFYTPVDPKFKYVDFITMEVAGARVFLCTNDYNTRSSGGKENAIVLSELNITASGFAHHALKIETELKNMSGKLVYQPADKSLRLLIYEDDGHSKGYDKYALSYANINSESLNASSGSISQESLTAYGKQCCNEKRDYVGTPVDFVVNPDNTVTILFEERMEIGGGNLGVNGTGRRANSTFATENIGLLHLNANGQVASASQIRKCQSSYHPFSAMNVARNLRRIMQPEKKLLLVIGDVNTNDFYSFNYFNTSGGERIIFNAPPDNFKREDKSPLCMGAVSGMTTMLWTMHDGKWEKDYLWGAPNNQFDVRFTRVSSADYDARSGTYAAMIVEQKGGRKMAHIAWTTLK